MQRRALIGWAQTLLLNVAMPVATYVVLTGLGVSPVVAYVASGAWPVLQIVLSTLVHRQLDALSVVALAFVALSIVATVATGSPRLALLRDSVWTAIIGVLFLGSLVLPRPLGFYFGRRFATDGTPESSRWWDGLWRYPAFRRSQRVITAVWGVAFVADAVLRVWLVLVLPVSAGAIVSPLLVVAAIATAMTITISIGRRTRRAAGAAVSPAPAE